jgi:hypothetical protein
MNSDANIADVSGVPQEEDQSMLRSVKDTL